MLIEMDTDKDRLTSCGKTRFDPAEEHRYRPLVLASQDGVQIVEMR